MRANVYALFEVRDTPEKSTFDVYMVTATQQEAIDYYREKTGRSGDITARHDHDGHEVLELDGDETGAGYVSQYNVGLAEITEE